MAMNLVEPGDPRVALQELFERRGGEAYGEAVTQLEHALQSGAAAEHGGAAPPLVVAAVLQ